MKLIVFGVGGTVGSYFEKFCKEEKSIMCYFLTRKDADVTQWKETESVIANIQPDVVVNCTGYVRSDLAEKNIEETYTVNVLGAIYLALACRNHNARLVQMDTVLSIAPVNHYGTSKKIARDAVEKILGNAVYIPILSWLFGEKRSNNFTDLVLDAIKAHKSIEVTRTAYGSPTYAPDAIRYIIKQTLNGASGKEEIANKGRVTRWDYCNEIFKILHRKNTFVINDNFKETASRPSDMSLNGNLRPYEEALKEYLKQDHKTLFKKPQIE